MENKDIEGNSLISYTPEDNSNFGNFEKKDTAPLDFYIKSKSSEVRTPTNGGERYQRFRQYRIDNINNAILSPSTSSETSNTAPQAGKVERVIKGSITGPAELEAALDEYFAENPQDIEHRDFLTRIAKRESSFQNVQNSEGAPAYGYFQLWETNLGNHTPEEVMEDPKLQIKLAIELDKRNLATFTQEDFELAEKKGYTKNALRWGSWLGGPGNREKQTGVKGYLYHDKDASDSHHYSEKGKGSSISKYMAMGNYKDGGTVEEKKFSVKIHGKSYKIKVAETEEDKSIGLSKKDKLPDNEGMLFVINEEDKDTEGLVWFTMEDTKIPLDIVFINNDYEVLQVTKGEPLTKEPIYGKADYVLEINADSGITVGSTLEFSGEDKVNDKMMVLDVDGNPQMTLDGGERIFSIKDTRILIRFAKKSKATGKDNDYKALGKRVFKFLKIQDSNDPEYV